ncbi:MAG: hypothetical protein MUD05_01785 [Candidatus Nanopelagicales bacterium]|nr:hypothetical protein [Candidatus Nanopelagicales bacterium]
MSATFLLGLPVSPAVAVGETLQLAMNNPPRITGSGWPDQGLLVCRGTQFVGTTNSSGGSFQFGLDRAARVGEVYTVTGDGSCDSPGTPKASVAATLDVTTVDVANGWVYGTGGSPSGTLSVSVGGPYGSPANTSVTPNPDGTWAVHAGQAAFDLMRGVGVGLQQQLPAGFSVSRNFPVPNPMISIWDTHGVAARDWTPNTPLQLSLTDPSRGQSYQWTVTTDENGNFWDVPPDPEWQVLQPGWIAKATGSIKNRETATLTKTLALPEPLPLPSSLGAYVLAGTVPGTLTSKTVGQGSFVQSHALCRSSDFPQRSMISDPITGGYSFDFAAAQSPPWGQGDPCTSAVHYYGLGIRDLDGDEMSVNWHVAPVPKVSTPDLVYDGLSREVTGQGFDLTSVQISQCQMSGTTVLGCDPATTFQTNDYPDDQWDQYPFGYGRFEQQVSFQRYLDLGGSEPVDCATAPGTCAVVVTEPHRNGVVASGPLTFGFDPYVEVHPANNLVGGEQLTVTGSDFPPGTTFPLDVALAYGSPGGSLVDHDTMRTISVTPSAAGEFSVSITAARLLHISAMPGDPKLDVDCATVSPAGSDRCGVYVGWPIIPQDLARDGEFFVPLAFQAPAGTQGPPGPPGLPGATGATGATGQPGPAGEAPLVAVFAPGRYSVNTGTKLKVPYALSAASTVTATLSRKALTVTKTVTGKAGTNMLTWKLVKAKKPLPTGKYRLSLSAAGRTLTTTTVKVVR